MEIFIPNIPNEGQKIKINPQEAWVKELIDEHLEKFLEKPIQVLGDVQLLRFDKNVSLSGKLHLEFQAHCDFCAQVFQQSLDFTMKRHIIPYFDVGDESLKNEVELQEEDLEFSTYVGEEINLSDILAEEINLALPMHLLCQENCAGLCPKCGKNLNEGPCQCSDVNESSPFAALKDIKFPS